MESAILEDKKLCECGCGGTINTYVRWKSEIRRFVKGHSSRGSNNPAWKGGRTVEYRGYILIKKPDHKFATRNGYIMEHRIIWEEYNKACLLPWADIHHINQIKDDNRIENLHVMMHRIHVSLHFTKDMSDRLCFNCNKKTTAVTKKGHPKWFRHPITKQEWLCNRCSMEVYHKLEKTRK
jgi:hypothetical protein